VIDLPPEDEEKGEDFNVIEEARNVEPTPVSVA
jgi:hypothetical protein